jgi:hypothetical protein
MIAHRGKILHTATTHQHNRMLLKVMPLSRNICSHLNAIGKTHTGDFPERGIGFLGSRGIHTGTYAPLLRTPLEGRSRTPAFQRFTPFTNQLTDSRQTILLMKTDAFSDATTQDIKARVKIYAIAIRLSNKKSYCNADFTYFFSVLLSRTIHLQPPVTMLYTTEGTICII